MELFGELIREALHEITAKPVVFIAELVQFGILIGIIAYFLPRYFGKMLKERQERIIDELADAKDAREEYSHVKEEVTSLIKKAEAEAASILKPAKEDAEKELEEQNIQIANEAEEIIRQAEQTIEAEKQKVISDATSKLVGLITSTTKLFIEESLTETERRALTQKMILGGLEDIDSISLS